MSRRSGGRPGSACQASVPRSRGAAAARHCRSDGEEDDAVRVGRPRAVAPPAGQWIWSGSRGDAPKTSIPKGETGALIFKDDDANTRTGVWIAPAPAAGDVARRRVVAARLTISARRARFDWSAQTGLTSLPRARAREAIEPGARHAHARRADLAGLRNDARARSRPDAGAADQPPCRERPE